MIVKRFEKYVKSHEFRIKLPEFFFQGATLVFNPKKGLADFDVEFPAAPENEDRSISAGKYNTILSARNFQALGSRRSLWLTESKYLVECTFYAF